MFDLFKEHELRAGRPIHLGKNYRGQLAHLLGVYVQKTQKVSELAPIILSKMDWPAGTEFMLFEEIHDVDHGMFDLFKEHELRAGRPIHLGKNYRGQLAHGDIITFQRAIKESELPASALYTDARQFYDYLLNFDLFKEHELRAGRPIHLGKNYRGQLAHLLGLLNKMDWPAGTEFMLFEEIKHTMIDVMKPKQTFQQSDHWS
jgi:hypothetical protein